MTSTIPTAAVSKLSDAALIDAIDRIYSAATDPGQWRLVMELMVSVYGAQVAFLFGMDVRAQRVTFTHVAGLSADVLETFERDYANDDIRIKKALQLPIGMVSTEQTLMSAEEYRSSRIYNDLLRPIDLPHILGVFPFRSKSALVTLSLNRSARGGPFSAEERSFLARLVPHIQRAALISNQLSGAQAMARLSMETLDRVSFGVVFLDAAGEVLELNAAARRILDSFDGIELRGRRLSLANAASQRAFAMLIQAVCAGGQLTGLPVALAVPRLSGRRSYRIVAVPGSRPYAWRTGSHAEVMVALFDSDRPFGSVREAVQMLYKLSGAEARVTEWLVAGERPEKIAERLGISVSTVRTHLKRIHEKMGVASQADVVREVLLGPAAHILNVGR